ncbi:MAG: phosphoglycerate kinase [Chloroflexota bacterium]|nr:phosphoglycerate kinase [Chloroflexota bacterium]
MRKRSVRDANVTDKRVLVRVDFNLPFIPNTTVISDDVRIHAVLPTLKYLRNQGAKIILCSHLGRPGGTIAEDMRLGPVARRLEGIVGQDIVYVDDCIGSVVGQAAKELGPGQIMLLENLRFYPEEETNDEKFAQELASVADIYVNDAFGASHRAHASIVAVTNHLPPYVGLQMERELSMLSAALNQPERPLAAIMGGAKIGDKIDVLHSLVQKVDKLFIGGGMASTFFKAQGFEVGDSLVEDNRIPVAKDILRIAESNGVEVFLPKDLVVTQEFLATAPFEIVGVEQIPATGFVMDVGPMTIKSFKEAMQDCRTLLWNGPMGVFEYKPFAVGTTAIAEILADLNGAITIVGGGSTAEAVDGLGLSVAMNHVSMGGGASLEFLEGRLLPGIEVLPDKV